MLEFIYNIVIFPISEIIHFLFSLFFVTFQNVLLSIFIVSFFINLICLPLYMRAEKIRDEELQIREKIAPQVKSIKKNFKGDERFMMLQTCYKQNHYHPIMALRTSLALLIQIPFFFAAYTYFNHLEILNKTHLTVDKTLSNPDGLLNIFGISINLLPIVMTVINIISAELYSYKRPLKDKLQMYSFALFFLVLLYNSPSGLVIYWTFNNIFSLIKNIGLKTKNPVSFFKKFCLTASFCLLAKILYAKITNKYYIDILYGENIFNNIIVLLPLLYVIYYVSSEKNKEKIKKFFGIDYNFGFKSFLLSCLSLPLIMGIIVPSILIGYSSDIIQLMQYYIFSLILSFTFSSYLGIYLFWGSILYYFSNNIIRNVLIFIFSSLTLIYIANICLYKGEFGFISTALSFKMPQYDYFKMFLDFIITIFIIAFVYFCLFKNKIKILKNLLVISFIVSLCFGLYNTIKIYKLITDYKNNQKIAAKNFKEIKQPIKISKNGKNVIVIFIDRLIGTYVREILEEDKTIKDKYKGFVLYPNTLSFYGQTVVAYPPMIGGYEYTPENMEKRKNETYEQKTNEACLVLPKLFLNNGFKSVIVRPHYSFHNQNKKPYDGQGIDLYYFPDNTENYNFDADKREKEVLAVISSTKSADYRKNYFCFSIYITAPSFIKMYLNNIFNFASDSTGVWDDRLIKDYKQLLSLSNLTGVENSNNNYFTVFNNETAHINVYNSAYKKEHIFIIKEALYSVGKYLDYLRNSGVYDNTRIILVADHGHWGQESKYLINDYINYNPVLMVKNFNSKEDLKIDMDFMTNADAPLLAVSGIIKNPINPYSGKSLFDSVNKSEVKVLQGTNAEKIIAANKYTARLNNERYYSVRKSIFEPKNWEFNKKPPVTSTR